MTDIKNRILAEVQKYREIAVTKGYHLPVVPIDFKLRGGVAGRAWHSRVTGKPIKLQFNLELAARHPEEFLKRTVPHECAHMLQFQRNPRSKSHGAEWDFFCRLLTGSTMPRCHSYDTTGIKRTRKVQRIKYVCDCKEHNVSSTIHNRIKAGRTYTCLDCKTDVRQLITTIR